MPLVVDSSVAACWALPDEFSRTADNVLARLAGDVMIVPSIFWYEIRNVLTINQRRRRISQVQSEVALDWIDQIARLESELPESESTMSLARRHALTVYDAAYLELAMRRGTALATLDTRLVAAATTEGITVIA